MSAFENDCQWAAGDAGQLQFSETMYSISEYWILEYHMAT